MRKVIYTVITDNCDKLREPCALSDGWDYVCFTDDPYLKSNTWKIKLLSNPIEPKKLSRIVKILPHKYLSEYDLSLYLDSYILINRDVNEFVNDQLERHEETIIIKSHPRRTNIFDEVSQIIIQGKDDPLTVVNQAMSYKRVGFDSELLFENGIMIRRHNETSCINVMNVWWNQIEKHSYRDQISLPYVLWKTGYKIGVFEQKDIVKYFSILSKQSQAKSKVKIFEGTPYGPNKQYGKALNEFCEQAPKDSWIIIRDRDTMYLEDNGQQIIDIAERYPDTGVFGCMTNRLGLNWQLHNGEISEDSDILNHYKIAKELKEKNGTECATIGSCVGGLFLMFKKSTWEKVHFREGNIIQNNIYFDWDFVARIKDLNMPIRLMMGVYIFHYYRLHKNVRDITHLI